MDLCLTALLGSACNFSSRYNMLVAAVDAVHVQQPFWVCQVGGSMPPRCR